MTIKHLVFSGGGPIMLPILAAIQHLEKADFIQRQNIESIYGTSAGAIIGILYCLNYEWETINDYLIKRPWQDVFPIKVQAIFDSYAKKGIFDIKTVEKCFKPLFDAKDIPMNISLADFFTLTKIELHFFAFEINQYIIEDISYLTHPHMTLMTALQMTCAIPVLLSPVCIEDKCYIDGGIVCNYPLNKCIESGKTPDEILGFKNKYTEQTDNIINNDSNMLDFLTNFLFKMIQSISTSKNQQKIKNEVLCDTSYLSIEILKNVLSSSDVRKTLFNEGQTFAENFLAGVKLQDSV